MCDAMKDEVMGERARQKKILVSGSNDHLLFVLAVEFARIFSNHNRMDPAITCIEGHCT